MRRVIFGFLSGLLVIACGCTNGHFKADLATPTVLSVPTALTATAGDGQVALKWGAVGGAHGYGVYYATKTGVTQYNGTKLYASSTPSFTVTGLTDGTEYFFVVTALGDAGESSPSNEANATPVPPVPAAPTGLTATAGPNQVALSWTASTGATSYNVYYGTSSSIAVGSGTKVSGITGLTTTVSSLTAGTTYYFIVTAVNLGGESPASTAASATPISPATISLKPGTAGSATVNFNPDSLTFNFAANAVSAPADVDINPVTQGNLAGPLSVKTRANASPMVQAGDTFILAFDLAIDPTSITTFNVPVGISGMVDPKVSPAGVTLNLAMWNGTKWVDIATFVVGANGAITENLVTTVLQGLLLPGHYLLYQPAPGTSTSISNFGVALLADDGSRMADGKNGLQIINLYDKEGNLLSTPLISYLDYAYEDDLDGQAMTPDGSQGIMVDGSNVLNFFSGVQTGVPVASTTTVDISNYGGDGDSVGILPNGDEAVVSGDDASRLLVVSGIVSGNPVAAETITVPDYRDGVVVSGDGKVLLARGSSGMTVFSIADITPVAGSIGGTVAHSYAQVMDLPALGAGYSMEDGRDGMAISPVDSSRAVVVSRSNDTVQLVTGLPATPTAAPAVNLPSGSAPVAVSVSPDGKLAVVGAANGGLYLLSGVDTGTLTLVGTVYAPTYTLGTSSVTLGAVMTLGITLDGKYVVAGDLSNKALVVIPFTSAGFADAPAAVLGGVTIPYNDQLLLH